MTNNKFRVWCRDYNEWEKDPIFLSQDGTPYHLLRGQLVAIKPYNHVVQFFTGLFDSNGVAIYDGDLLKGYWEKGNTGVRYKEPSIFEAKWNSWSNGWFKYHTKSCPNRDFRRYPDWEKCLIVGNIFQNSELLKS